MATYSELEQQYQQERGSRESLDSVKSKLENELGLSGQRKRVRDIGQTLLDTERLLEGVDPRVAQRARQLGGPVTEGTRQRLVEVGRRPLVQDISKLSRAQDSARIGASDLERDVMNKLGLINQERSSADNDWMRRLNTAFSAEQQAAAMAAQQQALPDWESIIGALGLGGGNDLSAMRQSAADAVRKASQRAVTSSATSSGLRNLFNRNKTSTSKSGRGVKSLLSYARKK